MNMRVHASPLFHRTASQVFEERFTRQDFLSGAKTREYSSRGQAKGYIYRMDNLTLQKEQGGQNNEG